LTNLCRVFFPLRSNIGWFQTYNIREEIVNRVKQALLIYDELYIEDGTFEAAVLEHGGWYPYYPPDSIPPEERVIKFERDLKPTKVTLAVGPDGSPPTHSILHGDTIARFKIDYYEIFKDLNVSSYDFIKFVVVDKTKFPRETRTIIDRMNFTDKRLFKDIENNIFLRDLVIGSLNHDLIASILLRSALVVDPRHEELLRRKCLLPTSVFKFLPVKEEAVIRHLLAISVPDFGALSLEQVLELRQDALWREFRTFVGRVSDSISGDPEVLLDPGKLQCLVNDSVTKKLVEELRHRYTSKSELAIDLGLGVTSLIPGYGILATMANVARSVYNYFQQKSGWFVFLMKMKRKEN